MKPSLIRMAAPRRHAPGDTWQSPGRRVRFALFSIVVAVVVATLTPPAVASPRLRAIDLGTLDGHCCSQASAINDHGEIVGNSFEPFESRRAFVWRHGQMTDLGEHMSWASDINNHGDIVGTSYRGGISFRAVLWRGGQIVDLGTLGGRMSYALAINEAGEVVGASTVAGDSQMHAFSWRDSVMTDLGPLDEGRARAINNRGQIVGQYGYLPVLWQRGTMQSLTTRRGEAVAINDRGQIVGSDSGGYFLWSAGRIIYLVPPSGVDHITLFGINNRGDMIGYAHPGAFLWRQGQMTILPELITGALTLPTDINNRGQVIGSSTTDYWTSHSRAVLWTY